MPSEEDRAMAISNVYKKFGEILLRPNRHTNEHTNRHTHHNTSQLYVDEVMKFLHRLILQQVAKISHCATDYFN